LLRLGLGFFDGETRAAMIGANVQVENISEGGALVKCTVQNARPNQQPKKSGKKATAKTRATESSVEPELATK
jgi:hypothetical protein